MISLYGAHSEKRAAMSEHSYPYPRPALTVDVIILRWYRGALQALLIERDREPFKGSLALPGGFVDAGESLREAAARETVEETHIHVDADALIEVGSFADPGRDPRGWTISVAFVALLQETQEARAGDDAARTAWISWSELIDQRHPLAFDHQQILASAHAHLTTITLTSPELLAILPSPFRVRDARHLYRQITQREISPRVFKAWLRRGEALERVRRALYKARATLKRPW